jgi:hypothetical protein
VPGGLRLELSELPPGSPGDTRRSVAPSCLTPTRLRRSRNWSVLAESPTGRPRPHPGSPDVHTNACLEYRALRPDDRCSPLPLVQRHLSESPNGWARSPDRLRPRRSRAVHQALPDDRPAEHSAPGGAQTAGIFNAAEHPYPPQMSGKRTAAVVTIAVWMTAVCSVSFSILPRRRGQDRSLATPVIQPDDLAPSGGSLGGEVGSGSA